MGQLVYKARSRPSLEWLRIKEISNLSATPCSSYFNYGGGKIYRGYAHFRVTVGGGAAKFHDDGVVTGSPRAIAAGLKLIEAWAKDTGAPEFDAAWEAANAPPKPAPARAVYASRHRLRAGAYLAWPIGAGVAWASIAMAIYLACALLGGL